MARSYGYDFNICTLQKQRSILKKFIQISPVFHFYPFIPVYFV